MGALGDDRKREHGLVSARRARQRRRRRPRPRRSRSGRSRRASRRRRPRGSSARISSRSGDGRYGWWRRSSKAAASQSARPAAIPAPRRAARATLKVASACGISAGNASRASAVFTSTSGITATGVSGSVSAIRAIRPPRSGRRRRRGRRRGCRSGPRAARRGRAGPRASGPAPSTSSPRRGRARSSPRSSRARGRAGSGRPIRTASPSGEATRPNARMPMCAGSGGRRAVGHVDLVPEVERDPGRVEARAEVRRGRARTRA